MQKPGAKLTKFSLRGNLSGEKIVIDIEVVVALIDAYMTVIPNEKRTLPTALKVLRFHEDLREVLEAEEAAGLDTIERKAIEEEDRV